MSSLKVIHQIHSLTFSLALGSPSTPLNSLPSKSSNCSFVSLLKWFGDLTRVFNPPCGALWKFYEMNRTQHQAKASALQKDAQLFYSLCSSLVKWVIWLKDAVMGPCTLSVHGRQTGWGPWQDPQAASSYPKLLS